MQAEVIQLKREQGMANVHLQKMVLDRSMLNGKADLKGIGHRTRVVTQPTNTAAWFKVVSKDILRLKKVNTTTTG